MMLSMVEINGDNKTEWASRLHRRLHRLGLECRGQIKKTTPNRGDKDAGSASESLGSRRRRSPIEATRMLAQRPSLWESRRDESS